MTGNFCQECNQNYATRRVHVDGIPMWVCDVCARALDERAREQRAGMETPTMAKRTYECPKCGETFEKARQLTRHLRGDCQTPNNPPKRVYGKGKRND